MKKANLVIFLTLISAPVWLFAQPASPAFSGDRGGSKGMTSASDTESADVNRTLETPVVTLDKKNRTVADTATPTGENVVVLPSNPAPGTNGTPVAPVPAPARDERLDSTAMAKQIRTQTPANRAVLLSALDERLGNNDREGVQIERASTGLSYTARDKYKQSLSEFKMAQKNLRRNLRAAHTASDENWSSARVALANDFEAYSLALARLEANSALDR